MENGVSVLMEDTVNGILTHTVVSIPEPGRRVLRGSGEIREKDVVDDEGFVELMHEQMEIHLM